MQSLFEAGQLLLGIPKVRCVNIAAETYQISLRDSIHVHGRHDWGTLQGIARIPENKPEIIKYWSANFGKSGFQLKGCPRGEFQTSDT